MCVVFTLNRSFYPTTSVVHPVSVLIFHPTRREIQTMWSQTVRHKKNKTTAINRGKASEMLAYLVCMIPEHDENKPAKKMRRITRKRRKGRKKKKKADRFSEECDARRSQSLQKEQHMYVLKKNRYNCCTDETTRRRARRNRHKAGKKTKKKSRQEI